MIQRHRSVDRYRFSGPTPAPAVAAETGPALPAPPAGLIVGTSRIDDKGRIVVGFLDAHHGAPVAVDVEGDVARIRVGEGRQVVTVGGRVTLGIGPLHWLDLEPGDVAVTLCDPETLVVLVIPAAVAVARLW